MKTALYCEIGNQAPEYIRLLQLGEVILGDGRPSFLVTQNSLEKIIDNWKVRANDMVIDYEHQTVTGQEAPAAGWVKELFIKTDGLWAKVNWTDRARDYIEKKEYRYFSPVVDLGEKREVMDLLHVALTNFPAISNLEPLILQHQEKQETQEGAAIRLGEVCAEVKKSHNEKHRSYVGEEMIIGELRMILGLQEDASEAQILGKAMDLVKAKEEKNYLWSKEICRLLELEEGDSINLALEKIVRFRAEAEIADTLREELRKIKKDQSQQQADGMIQEALRSRKTSPAELESANGWLRQLAYNDPELFRGLILSRQQNWAVPGPLEEDRGAIATLSTEEGAICELFGIAPEAFINNRKRFFKGE